MKRNRIKGKVCFLDSVVCVCVWAVWYHAILSVSSQGPSQLYYSWTSCTTCCEAQSNDQPPVYSRCLIMVVCSYFRISLCSNRILFIVSLTSALLVYWHDFFFNVFKIFYLSGCVWNRAVTYCLLHTMQFILAARSQQMASTYHLENKNVQFSIVYQILSRKRLQWKVAAEISSD